MEEVIFWWGYFGKHGCRKYLGFGVLMGVAWKVLEAMRERGCWKPCERERERTYTKAILQKSSFCSLGRAQEVLT